MTDNKSRPKAAGEEEQLRVGEAVEHAASISKIGGPLVHGSTSGGGDLVRKDMSEQH
jgi:hypothetical protein